MRYLCQPCDHRWWEHRHPNPTIRAVGVVMMFMGAIQIGAGLALLFSR